ncbi:MAG: FAD-linked oxidase C-terminal domain-containing protein, partial [Syntrophorhabdales bacterium]
ITKAELKLNPLPPARKTIVAAYDNIASAGESVYRVLENGVIPDKIELIDNWVINRIEEMMPIPDHYKLCFYFRPDFVGDLGMKVLHSMEPAPKAETLREYRLDRLDEAHRPVACHCRGGSSGSASSCPARTQANPDSSLSCQGRGGAAPSVLLMPQAQSTASFIPKWARSDSYTASRNRYSTVKPERSLCWNSSNSFHRMSVTFDTAVFESTMSPVAPHEGVFDIPRRETTRIHLHRELLQDLGAPLEEGGETGMKGFFCIPYPGSRDSECLTEHL